MSNRNKSRRRNYYARQLNQLMAARSFLHTCSQCGGEVDHIDVHELLALVGPKFDALLETLDPADVVAYWRCANCGNAGAIVDPESADA